MKALRKDFAVWQILMFISLATILSGCSEEPVQVLVSSSYLDKNEVRLDGNLLTEKIKGNHYDILMVLPGKHVVSIGDNSEREFEVGKNGGLLNLEGNEFVLFPINFQKSKNSRSINIPLPVIVDSLVVFHKKMGSNQAEIMKIMNNKALIRSALFGGGQKFDSKKLFINKKWDFSIDDTVPNVLELKRPDNWDLEVKTKLMHLEEFLEYSKLSNEYLIQKIEDKTLIELVDSYNN